MYKIAMMRTLFTYEEILAYCLMDISNDEGVIFAKDKEICLKTSISERQYYYIMKKFKDSKILTNNKKHIKILDADKLKKISSKVVNFMKNSI